MVKKNAYVWIVFRGDRYIPGVLVSAYSIKRTNTKHDLVCLVTPDVSKRARKELLKVLDEVIEVPYIEVKGPKLKKFIENKESRYDEWINVSYSKWNVLNMIKFKKIFFLDADTIITKNIDKVFDYKGIAGVFYAPSSTRFNKYSKIKDYFGNRKVIKPYLISKALQNSGYVASGSSLLLHPKRKYFKQFLKMLKNKDIVKQFSKNNFAGFDEQSLAYFMSVYKDGPRLNWDRLPECYQFYPGKSDRNDCCKRGRKSIICPKILVVHYIGDDLNWEINFHDYQWNDVQVWLGLCQEMLNTTTVNVKNINIKYPESLSKKINYNLKYFKVFFKKDMPKTV